MQRISDVRSQLIEKYRNKEYVVDKSGVKTVELIGSTFLVDDDYIVRKTNQDYFLRELEWYKSQSLYVKDIPGKVPLIWEKVSSKENDVGKINSNYGYLVWSKDNFSQYENTLNELKKNPDSRRAIMIYNRPSMHYEYNKDGMSDFICTLANQFFIRNNKLVMHVTMRSNDAVFGFGNDRPWFQHVQKELAKDLGIEVGDYIHTAGSLHVYEMHFKHLDELIEQGY